jgi:hypothetical protein
VKTPEVVIRPILLPMHSVNHSAPSGPVTMPRGLLSAVGTGNSVMTPAGVIRPILLPSTSVNHTFPSGPAAIPRGLPLAVGTGNSAKTPDVVTRPILFAPNSSVNQSAPSGPAAMAPRLAVGRGDRELGDHPLGGNPSNLVGPGLREPQVPVRARGDAVRKAASRGDRELPSSNPSLGCRCGGLEDEEGHKEQEWEQSNWAHGALLSNRRATPGDATPIPARTQWKVHTPTTSQFWAAACTEPTH